MGFPFKGADPSDDSHVENRGSSKRFLGWVTEIDWATRLANALSAPQAMMAATKAVPGIMRFATDAEATTATFDGGAVTPKQALALLRANPRTFANLTTLFAQTTAPEGAIASVGRFSYSTGVYHRESVWHKSNGSWTPIGGLFQVEAADDAGARTALAGILADVTAVSGTAYFPPGTQALNIVTAARYRWLSTNAWLQVNERVLGAGTDWAYSGTALSWDTNSFANELRILEGGTQAQLTIGVRKSTAYDNWQGGNQILSVVNTSARPKRQYNNLVAGYGSTNGWIQGAVPLALNSDGGLIINAVQTSVTGLFGTITYPIT